MNNPPLSLVARRRLLWRICLAQLPPDERERVLADPSGPEALSFAVTVELFAQEDPEKLHALLAATPFQQVTLAPWGTMR